METLQAIKIERNSELGAVVSSRTVAEELGKRHGHVIDGIEDLILENRNIGSLIIPSTYKVEGQKRSYKEYLLTKDGFTLYMFNIQGHNEFKMAYINRFNEMEKQLTQPTASYMIDDPVKRAEFWIEEQKEKQQLQLENQIQQQQIGELKPKADYYDQILKSKKLITVNAIAKDYGMSGQAFNKLLHDLKVQFKQSGQWLLYAKYHDKSYTHAEPHKYVKKDGTEDFRLHTKWTQKGRIFLYNLLKENDILPSIEK
ncbi:Rha family transcriptional regulator [Staphylococcus xylosus]|uniref:phage regulatory protein/antirepressor Ant n=1 Tax=Staphylococcus xylosus TaxID=1288 RepID=UPI000E694D7A|nr:phage regulatory protein/antirepressor Ant [Staphylococcus xylosus]RIM85828.1 Rha family transcriptional regulator [Staphylococcus xylosus]